MSSHQNSAFNGESALNLMPSPLSRSNYRVRVPRVRNPGQREDFHAPDEIWGQYNNYRANGVVVSAIVHVALIGTSVKRCLFRPSNCAKSCSSGNT